MFLSFCCCFLFCCHVMFLPKHVPLLLLLSCWPLPSHAGMRFVNELLQIQMKQSHSSQHSTHQQQQQQRHLSIRKSFENCNRSIYKQAKRKNGYTPQRGNNNINQRQPSNMECKMNRRKKPANSRHYRLRDNQINKAGRV